MADQRKGGIAWTDQTWNPTRGCSPVSPGCAKCYAETVAARFSGVGKPYEGLVDGSGRWNGAMKLVEDHLEDPLRWQRPRRVFVNSMSDLFHENVPFDYIDKVFGVMALATRHTFQVLTKRQDRMLEYFRVHRDKPLNQCPEARIGKVAMDIAFSRGEDVEQPNWDMFWQWPIPNVWLGVSVENQTLADTRIPVLLQTPAAVRFISAEPLLGPVDLSKVGSSTDGPDWHPLIGWKTTYQHKPRSADECAIGVLSSSHTPTGVPHPKLDWVIIGGESGQGARPFNLEWARSIIRQCRAADVAVFMKQVGKLPYEGMDPYASGPAAAGCRLYELDIDKGHGGDPVEWPDDLRVREFPEVRGRA